MIAPESKIILIPLLAVVLIATGMQVYGFGNATVLKWVNLHLWVFTAFSLYFFRDPIRIPVGNVNEMVSPADGKVVQIIEVDDPEIGEAKQISIFLSVFNVHCQRVPLAGRVISSFYNSGKFFAAFNHKASLDNEQTSIVVETDSGEKYKVKQIAGLVARRILNYMEPDARVEKGQRLGFIRFGSRVDIIVPQSFKIDVILNDIVQGNISIIGKF